MNTSKVEKLIPYLIIVILLLGGTVWFEWYVIQELEEVKPVTEEQLNQGKRILSSYFKEIDKNYKVDIEVVANDNKSIDTVVHLEYDIKKISVQEIKIIKKNLEYWSNESHGLLIDSELEHIPNYIKLVMGDRLELVYKQGIIIWNCGK